MKHKLSKIALKVSCTWTMMAIILTLGMELMIPGTAHAATWYVDGVKGTDDGVHGTGQGTNAFKTIQYSINDGRVGNGDTINVAPATYNEDIQVTKGLTIQSSSGAASTIIRGSGTGSSYYMIRIYHSDVTFDGFTVTNPDYQGGADASGIVVGNYLGGSVNNINILNNIIEEVRDGTGGSPSSYGATGINIGRGAPNNITISGNTIENIHNPDGASIDHTCGINVWDNGNDIVVSNNSISDIKYNGIYIQFTHNVQVISNTITQCQSGIKIDPYEGAAVSGLTIHHNIIVGNTSYGVDNHDTSLVNATNNWWGCNDGPGIIGPGSGDKVSDNVTYEPWLVLNLCANPPSIAADGISTSFVIADMTKNSNGQDTSAQGCIPDGTQIIFSTDKGSLDSPTTKLTASGIATAVFTSDSSPSLATLSAKAPKYYTCAIASASVDMYQPPPPEGQSVGVSPCNWTEYENNPVFGQWIGGAKAYYPKVIYDPNQFSGHGDSYYYKMWFGSSSGIGYAYSNDGINWTVGTNPITGPVGGAGHPLVEYDSDGFGQDVYYKLWYWTGNMTYSINDLRYAESGDGINWTNDQALTQDSILPLVTSNPGPDWNAGSYGPCDIIYNPSGSSSFDDCNIWNNKYVMYYMGTTGGNEFIGLAYSINGMHWKRYGNDPVLSPCDLVCDSPAACWDYCSVGYCSVINLSGSWQMWYGGGPGTKLGIGYATSSDGVNWAKHPDNPIFHVSDNLSWRNDRTYTPWVLYDPDDFSGHGDAYPYKMWFSGVWFNGDNNNKVYRYSVGYAGATPLAVDAGPDKTIVAGGSAIIGGNPTASGGTPPYSYDWSPITGLDDPSTANPTASPTFSTNYTVTVTDSKGCMGSNDMALSVQPPSPAGGGGGTTPGLVACPLALIADMQGATTIASMTGEGVLCNTCIARDASGKYILEMDEGTQLLLAGNTVPQLLEFRELSAPPPPAENTVLVGSAYEVNAYPTPYASAPSPITISPPAMLTLAYDPKDLPENAIEVYIANYDEAKGWQVLSPVPGAVAELGKAQGLASHFSPVAILAELAAQKPAEFNVSDLTIVPSQAQPNQEITIGLKITNTGEQSGHYNLQLKIDGIATSNKKVTVAPETSQTVNLTTSGYAPGKHRVEIAGLNSEFEVSRISPATDNHWWFFGSVAALILVAIGLIIALKK